MCCSLQFITTTTSSLSLNRRRRPYSSFLIDLSPLLRQLWGALMLLSSTRNIYSSTCLVYVCMFVPSFWGLGLNFDSFRKREQKTNSEYELPRPPPTSSFESIIKCIRGKLPLPLFGLWVAPLVGIAPSWEQSEFKRSRFRAILDL